MAERVGVAVFGLGRAGMIHFQNLFNNHEVFIQYLVESDLEKAKQVASTYHLQATKCLHPDNMETALNDPSVKAAIICAPTFEHEKIVRSALTHSKAVFCEKPVSQNVEGVKVLYDLADQVKKPLFCSFNRRFDPSLSALRDRCRSASEVGSIQMVKSCSRDSALPSTDYLRISGGMFHDCAIHDIDMCCWVVGEFPVEVYAMAEAHIDDIRKLNDVDTVLISMRFPSGTLATIDLSRFAAYGYDQRLEVFGSKGMLISENQRPTEVTSHLKTGTSQDHIKFSFPQRYADSYMLAMKHFLNVVQGKEEMSIKRTDAINVSMIASACETSHRTRKPVQLNLSN